MLPDHTNNFGHPLERLKQARNLKGPSRTAHVALEALRARSFFNDWQQERSQLLQSICERIEALNSQGTPVRRAVASMAKRYNQRCFKSEPSRKLSLSAVTLLQCFYTWKKAGRIASAFQLNYGPSKAGIVAPPIVRFVNFCGYSKQPSLEIAWEKFSKRGGSFGPGIHRKSPLPMTFKQVRRFFTNVDFEALQGCIAARETIELKLTSLRFGFIARIRASLPDRAAKPVNPGEKATD